MKLTYTLAFTLIGLFTCITVSGQTLTEKQKEREKNKVEIYTSDEKDNIQMWFYNKTNEMNLSKPVRDQYNQIITDNIFDMRRLNDKDKDYTQDEINIKFDKLVEKTNASVKPILTNEQYEMHLENFGKLMHEAKTKQNKE